MFLKKLRLEEACSLSILLNMAQSYINNKEELLVEEGDKGRGEKNMKHNQTPYRDDGC